MIYENRDTSENISHLKTKKVKGQWAKQMKKIKVFILSVFPAPYRMGVFKELSKQLDITVYFERVFDESRSPDWFENDFNGLKGGLLPGANNPGKKINMEIIKLLTEEQYDLVLAYDYSTPTAAMLMLLCRIKGIPYFINGDGAFINKGKFKRIVKRFFISGAQGCLANGEHVKNYFLNFGAKNENIFKHCFSSLYEKDICREIVDQKMKNNLRKKLKLPDGRLAISVGQFIDRKGYDVLIKAWKQINPNNHLLIIGGGEKEEEYRELIRELQIDNIEILGFKEKTVLFDYYKASDLFILPTREDVWGLVINEAMACGLPVITTDMCIAGLELIDNYRNGFIVPFENVTELTGRINEILSNDETIKKMGINNVAKIRPYTIENVSKSHIETFYNLLGIIDEDKINQEI